MECELHPACHSMSTNVYLVCACAPGIAFGLLSSSHDFPTTLQHGTDLAEYQPPYWPAQALRSVPESAQHIPREHA